MLELLKNLDAYIDCPYEEAREKFVEYISVCGIAKSDVELFIKEYPKSTLKYFYELGLDQVLAWYDFLPQKLENGVEKEVVGYKVVDATS